MCSLVSVYFFFLVLSVFRVGLEKRKKEERKNPMVNAAVTLTLLP